MNRRIEDYALLGDCRSAALVSREGSIDWLCFPRFDSPACFARLVGEPENGRWLLSPADEYRSERAYRQDTLVLETLHHTDDGTVAVTDALIPVGGTHRLVRLVEGRSGSVAMHMELRIRFDYGSIVPWVRRIGDGVHATGGPDTLVLRTPVELRGRDMTTQADFVVSEGDLVWFDLAWQESHLPMPEPANVIEMIETTTRWWREWVATLSYDGAYSDDVRRSLIVLKALTHTPSGAIVAAPTTSLPEWIGGTRNWDYRYCWLRDATFTLLALLQVGRTTEASSWRDWLIRAVAGDSSKLQIMYGIGGERRLPEAELDWLDGFAGSRPVRIGNGAADQLQIDVYGELMDAMHHARLNGIGPDPVAWHIQQQMLQWLADNWQRPDEGIWEVRSGRAQFVYSKVMAWVAFDRGVQAVEHTGLPGDAARWREIREQIHAEVCSRGVDQRGVFTQSYGSATLDASALMIPLVGFLPPNDPRVVATVEAIQRELTIDGLVQRYLIGGAGDGVGGEEGSFLLCSFWMVDALALMGRHEEATELFERLLSLRNDVGLLAEEYGTQSGQLLGNFPQAFSHIALASSAITLCPANTGPSEHRAGGA